MWHLELDFTIVFRHHQCGNIQFAVCSDTSAIKIQVPVGTSTVAREASCLRAIALIIHKKSETWHENNMAKKRINRR